LWQKVGGKVERWKGGTVESSNVKKDGWAEVEYSVHLALGKVVKGLPTEMAWQLT
jgi:hypothetical protein